MERRPDQIVDTRISGLPVGEVRTNAVSIEPEVAETVREIQDRDAGMSALRGHLEDVLPKASEMARNGADPGKIQEVQVTSMVDFLASNPGALVVLLDNSKK